MKFTSSYSRVAVHLTPRDLGDFPEKIWRMLLSIYSKPRRFLKSRDRFELSMPLLISNLNPSYQFEIRLYVRFMLDPESEGHVFDIRKLRGIYYVNGNADVESSTAYVFVKLYPEAVENTSMPLKEEFLNRVLQVADHEIAHLARQNAYRAITDEGLPVSTGWMANNSKENYEKYLASPHELDANFHSLIRIYHQLAKTHTPTIDELFNYFKPRKRKFYAQHPDIRKRLIRRFFREGLPLAKK